MHQVFYIDGDEEISSVIDRLNKSVSAENFFVVPKRAIFLQSIVNLKLLKREADKVGKHVVIVTQDEIGASMAERSGLETRDSMEGSQSIEDEQDVETESEESEFDFEDTKDVIEEAPSKKSRLSSVGSNGFYDSVDSFAAPRASVHAAAKAQPRKIHVNSVSGHDKVGHLPKKQLNHQPARRSMEEHFEIPKHSAKSLFGSVIDPGKEKSLEKMFAPSGAKTPKKETPQKVLEIGSSAKKIFMGFIGLCVLSLAGVAVYLFLPSAKVIITPNVASEKVDMTLFGGADTASVADTKMPIRVINKDKQVSLSYDVTGGSASAGKKAHGNVVIYNEFSNSPQTLVATTRLESADGKIFRIAKNVIVPGTTNIGGQAKPGAIEAEVVADQSGEDFNMAATTFTVPGFKGSPKFEKFYAKSTETFVGGSSNGGSSPSAVSQRDVDIAKQKTEEALKEQLKKEISDNLSDGEVALEQAERITIVKSTTSAKVGDAISKFDYVATGSIRVLVFSEKDAKTIIGNSVKDKESLKGTKWEITKIEYGISVADFDKNTLELKIHGEVTANPVIDTEKIKGDLLNKKYDQLEEVLKKYSYIKTVNVEFYPTFVSRIPQFAQRVSVEIKN